MSDWLELPPNICDSLNTLSKFTRYQMKLSNALQSRPCIQQLRPNQSAVVLRLPKNNRYMLTYYSTGLYQDFNVFYVYQKFSLWQAIKRLQTANRTWVAPYYLHEANYKPAEEVMLQKMEFWFVDTVQSS